MLSATSDEDDEDGLLYEEAFADLLDLDPNYQQVLDEAAAIRPPGPRIVRRRRYFQYIPKWTDPRVSASGTRPYQYRRPALLPEDRVEGLESDDPSKYALRFGKDPAAPWTALGRSMLTPITGNPTLTAADQASAHTQASIPDWLEDWQSFVLKGYTAAELKQQGAFDPDMTFQEPAMNMSDEDIHPLLRRDKWAQDQDEGRWENYPILLYRFDGTAGRWDMQQKDDILWNALQPTLKLVSRVLYSNPPFWRSILDLYKLGPVDSSRVPEAARRRGQAPDWENLTAVHLEIEDRNMYPEAVALRDSGFDASAVTEHVLDAYICFSFNDQIRGRTGCTELIDIQQSSGGDKRYMIEVTVAPQAVWPLLVPEYTASEKAVTSTIIASILLHELAHAVVYAHEILLKRPGWNTDPALSPFHINLELIPRQQLDLLTALGSRICGRLQMPMYFFQDEFRAEEGYAFEKQLWGGRLDSLINPETGMSSHDGFPGTIAVLREWPHTRCHPRPYFRRDTATPDEYENGWPIWLATPPPTLVRRETAVPVTMLSQYLDQSFWSTKFRKYGHQALKISRHQWEGRSLKSTFSYVLSSKRDVVRAFRSKTAYRWMRRAHRALVEAREYALATYMTNLSQSAVESDMMRRRLHYEKKTWPRTDAALMRLRREVRRVRGIATTRLREYKARRGVLPLGAVEVGRGLEGYLEQVRLLLIQGKELDRLLGEEVQYLQYLVLGFLRQENDARSRLQSYMDVIYERIYRVLEPAAATIIRTTARVNTEWLDVITEYAEACLAQNVRVDRTVRNLWGILTTMSTDANALYPPTQHHLDNLRNIIKNGRRVAAGGLAGSPMASNFDLLVDSAGLREIRTQRMRLRNLALRDMLRISRNNNLKQIVEEWLVILATQDRLRGAATEEERRAIQGDAVVDFSQFPISPPQVGEDSGDIDGSGGL
ncbi:hypothetical protein VP1G_04833 [Cytospora mali]|uniref:Uncharacterized protein n=1 Tax=Cytospora mali TaxID=578113 RepID=A0A194V0M3_CYTMA|nr:hypothetical protein VP1G_04833 [Valsa mali var. pyri (nom. inval.)]